MAKKWTKEENIFLKENYYTIDHKELSKKLCRTISSIRTKVSELGGGYPNKEGGLKRIANI